MSHWKLEVVRNMVLSQKQNTGCSVFRHKQNSYRLPNALYLYSLAKVNTVLEINDLSFKKSLLGYYEELVCIYYGLGDVFVVYCKDKGSQDLSPDNLYNPKLTSVERHPVLRKLKERERIISVNTKFHPHQVSHLKSCCNKIYL